MNTIKTFLAVSAALAATGSANAATYNFTASINHLLYSGGTFLGTQTGVGTATLDGSTGVLDMTLAINYDVTYAPIASSATYIKHDVINGTLTGSAFAWSSGTSTLSNCMESGTYGALLCDRIANGTGTNIGVFEFFPLVLNPWATDVDPIVFNFNGVTSFIQSPVQGVPYDIGPLPVYTLTAVPVPAAAWLFGSGLLGLAGLARRRAA